MTNKKSTSLALALLVSLALPAASQAELDLSTTPIIGITSSSMRLTRPGIDDRTAQFHALTAALLLRSNKWYGKVIAEIPLAGDKFWSGTALRDTERTDYGLTIGYRVRDRIGIYGGYLISETVFSASDFLATHSDSGPFIGASYDIMNSENGTITASIGYANLAGTILRVGSSPISSSGTTTGFNYGLGWTGRIGRSSNYSLGYRIRRYEYTGTGIPSVIKEYQVLSMAIVMATN